ncbi:hypothetical protein L3Y34_002180 [Caenorhabditis briggsae]|uniref:Uncharacterized protein n=1 Tax=Caenorhabditis briggsae TaxID=6238 RepID=A0AAE9DEP8_CAEBR|nr:hypothetical protein L3Y34_002180 [Caenorhabditis briggsae]
MVGLPHIQNSVGTPCCDQVTNHSLTTVITIPHNLCDKPDMKLDNILKSFYKKVLQIHTVHSLKTLCYNRL